VLLAGGRSEVEMIARRVIGSSFAHHECFGRAGHVSNLRKIRTRIGRARGEQIIVQRKTKWPLLVRIARATPQVRAAQVWLQRSDPGGGLVGRQRRSVFVIVRIHHASHADLFEIAETLRGERLALAARDGGHEHSSEDRDDGDHDQQFDQSKTVSLRKNLELHNFTTQRQQSAAINFIFGFTPLVGPVWSERPEAFAEGVKLGLSRRRDGRAFTATAAEQCH
jgi:hypothetical protein